jgi:small GTP-binding protein
VRLWEVSTGRCLADWEGHTSSVSTVAWSGDGLRALSASADDTLRLWDVSTGRCLAVWKGHVDEVYSVAWSGDGLTAISGSDDNTVRLWEVSTGRCLAVWEGHTGGVWSVGWSGDGQSALSGSDDHTVRLWEVSTGRCLAVWEGHKGPVVCVAWSRDGLTALSGSYDHTVRLWEVSTGRCLAVWEGHTEPVLSVAWSRDGQSAYSAAANGVMRIWPAGDLVTSLGKRARPTSKGSKAYTNAKVLLVGESGAGKTGLSMRLAHDTWEKSDSTVGAWATQCPLPTTSDDGIEREIWLWDFGGQADQRLIHQLFMDETSLAVLVFDSQKEDVFETLGQWDRDLTRAGTRPFTKLLVAGRTDAGTPRVGKPAIEAFAKERGFAKYLPTSAKKGTGCKALLRAIQSGIDWKSIPWRSTEAVFKRLKDEILALRDSGRVMFAFNELRETLRLRVATDFPAFSDDDLRTVLSLLAGPGVVMPLNFGSWVLLQPERINAYAQAVIQTVRQDEHDRGLIREDRVLRGELEYTSSMPRLEPAEESYVLLAMHKLLVEKGLCLRQSTDRGNQLLFPSYYRMERPELRQFPAVLMTYRIEGFLDEIYATLVVWLHHTVAFDQAELWRYAADFTTPSRKRAGLRLERKGPGTGTLEVYFDKDVPEGERILFGKYVHEHLKKHAKIVERERHYACPGCHTPVGNRDVAMERLNEWLAEQPPDVPIALDREDIPTILCVRCEKERIPLWDAIEEAFASRELQQKVREMREEVEFVLDAESKERALVGDMISTIALAGQIAREKFVSDHGIDMEIEFKNDKGKATNKLIYLQLKSGDSYLRTRASDGAEIFDIKKERHVRYWMAAPVPVYLVIRNSEGEIRWMEVRDWLRRETNRGKKPIRQIRFEGERFDVMAVRKLRERVLKLKTGEA